MPLAALERLQGRTADLHRPVIEETLSWPQYEPPGLVLIAFKANSFFKACTKGEPSVSAKRVLEPVCGSGKTSR